MALKVLNLYSGIGGNRKLWENVEVTAVEQDEKIANQYQKFFPEDKVIIGDAHEFLINNFEDFDFIWSSPPCQSHSTLVKFTRHKVRVYPEMKLYEEIIFLKNFCKTRFVIENVKPYYQPLIEPDAKLGRHLFWSNFLIPSLENLPEFKRMIHLGTTKDSKRMMDWLGLHYEKPLYHGRSHDPCAVLRNCIHPEIGNHIFRSGRN